MTDTNWIKGKGMNRKKVIRRKDMERIRLEQVQCSCLRQGSRLPKTCGGQVGGQVGKVFGFGVLAALIFTPLDIRKMYVRFRNMARFYLTGLALLMAFAMGTAHAAAWASKKQITINATKVPSNQNNFPVLISITDTDLRDDAQDDGDDICFTTDPDETNPANRLSHEIEYFDGGTGQLVAWVKIPNLSGSSDTQFYMHYGNPTCSSQQDATNVWDSNYKGVWHLGDGDNTAPNFYQDSTPNNNDGTLIDANGNTAQDDGQVGKAMDFFGDADRLNVGSDPELDNLGPMTFSMWVFTNTVAAGPTYWWKNASDGLQQRDNSTIGFTYDTDDTSVRRVPPDGYISADTWMYISFTWDGTSSYTGINIYRDGTEAASYPTTAGSGTVSDDSANDLIIAGRTTDKYADGVIDEVRISDIARSADWITTCYNNQSNQRQWRQKILSKR